MIYHCEKCNDTGFISFIKEGYEFVRPCACQKIRKSLINAEKSGLGGLLDLYTFDRFDTEYKFQAEMREKAEKFVNDKSNSWLTVLGLSGTGKSHICTAVCKVLLEKGYEIRFMSWVDEVRKLKAIIKEPEYDICMDALKNAEVLYIDDFFKSEPTSADIRLANELLNYRYNKARISKSLCKTIISSERLFTQLIKYDEAIAGRLAEMSENYFISLTKKNALNYRLKKLYQIEKK